MSYAQENGYTPVDFAALMSLVKDGVNAQFGTAYTDESFVGTNWYKFFYPIVQRLQESEVKTSEIFAKLQQYIASTNESISRSVITYNGLIDVFARAGYLASVKAPSSGDAGKIYICVDTDDTADDYAAKKLEICEIIRDNVAAGMVSQGAQVENLPIGNTQSFDFKFALPDRIPVLLKLTLTLSNNNTIAIDDNQTVRNKLAANIAARYQLGKDFEPKRYFAQTDAPWTADVKLEWSSDTGGNWHDTVFEAAFDELYTFGLEDITIVEA